MHGLVLPGQPFLMGGMSDNSSACRREDNRRYDHLVALPSTSVSTELRAIDVLLGPIPVGAGIRVRDG